VRAMEIAMFGHASGSNDYRRALRQLDSALGAKTNEPSAKVRLGNYVGAVYMPPVVQCSVNEYVTTVPGAFVGVYDTREKALDALRPQLDQPNYSICAWVPNEGFPALKHIKFATIALILARYDSPTRTPMLTPEDFQRKPGSLPRSPSALPPHLMLPSLDQHGAVVIRQLGQTV
jgi:hypothetical protein